jgi:hypothetical protein
MPDSSDNREADTITKNTTSKEEDHSVPHEKKKPHSGENKHPTKPPSPSKPPPLKLPPNDSQEGIDHSLKYSQINLTTPASVFIHRILCIVTHSRTSDTCASVMRTA